MSEDKTEKPLDQEQLDAIEQEFLAEEKAAQDEPDLSAPLPGDPAAGTERTPLPSIESSEAAAPNEPDQPPADDANEPSAEGQQPPEGVIMPSSGAVYDKLLEVWKGRGSPQQFDFQNSRWAVYTEGDGMKFVRTGGSGSVDSLYNSLSIG